MIAVVDKDSSHVKQRGIPPRSHSGKPLKRDEMACTDKKPAKIHLYDRTLLLSTLAVVLLGLMMVYSASIVVSEKMYAEPFHFVIRQLLFMTLGVSLAAFIIRIEIQQWQKIGLILFGLSLFFLVIVLVPGVGRQINGSTRWIGFSGIGFQVSEFAKFAAIIYLARYLVCHQESVKKEISGFLKPMILLAVMAALLLREPDFGSTAVIMAAALALLFLAGARVWQFCLLFGLVVGALAILAISSPYRMARLTSFLNPWQNPFDSGYQLTQSLIAFGRGSLLGVGLGESVQKLFYLPEAHTDFLFAVLAEELGLLGALVVIFLFMMIVYRILKIAREAELQKRFFAAYVAYGFGLWIAMQVAINIGVNTGILPTKGLTLPLMSYGGSSVLIMCIVFAIIFRIDYENRLAHFGLQKKYVRERVLKKKLI